MARPLTVVTYHYVRDPETSAFPRINALPVAAFLRQLDRFERDYSIVDPQNVLDAINGDSALPSDALLLTFDDGYRDHYATVFPILAQRGHTALFFPATQPLSEQRVLDVNKIQFVLAAVSDASVIAAKVSEAIEERWPADALPSIEDFRRRFGGASRYDDAETAFVKRMLQKGLPQPLRSALVDELFQQYVTGDEAGFTAELYASPAQLADMRSEGMHIGCHGHAHHWLDALSPAELRRDVETALDWLRLTGLIGAQWTMCYPHGGTDETVATTLRSLGCALAFTVERSHADLDGDPLRLARFDTNDFHSPALAASNATPLSG
jgi:peptidoglycan/xylan/chitin deacetylase (PgdA/CDA1 family)